MHCALFKINNPSFFIFYFFSMKLVLQRLRTFVLWGTMLLLYKANSFGQCVPPLVVPDPNPICALPTELTVVPLGAYAHYQWSTGDTIGKITVTAPGTYSVTVTCDDGTTFTALRKITAKQLPTARMISNVIKPCLLGQEVDLGVVLSGASLAGTVLVTIMSSTGEIIVIEQEIFGKTTINYPVDPTSTTTYTLLSVQNLTTGCSFTIAGPKTSTIVPVFQSEEDFPYIGGDDFFCQDGSTPLEVVWTDPEPTNIYWAPPVAPAIEGVSMIQASVEGLYQVAVTYSPDCIVDLDFYVDEDIPTPEIAGGPVCDGNPATLQTTESYVLYEWSTGDSSPEITVSDPGQYRVTITNDHGCTGFDVLTVPAFPAPVASINGPIALCTGQATANLNVTGFNVATYQWSTGETTSNIVAGAGDFTVTVTSNQGCTSEASQTVEQVITPTVTLSSPFSFCEGSPALLSANTSTPEVNYQWSTGATTSGIPLSQGGLYRVTVSDMTGECTSTAFSIVTMKTRPAPEISSSATAFCEGNTATLSLPAGLGTYIWSNGGNSENISINTGGTYTVTVTASNGCTGTDTEQVTLLQQSAPTAIAFKPLCNRSVQLTADTGYSTYQWSNGAAGPSIQTSSTGPFTVTVTNAAGCTSSSTYNVTVLPSAPAPALTPVSYLCQNGTMTLDVGSSYVSYAWSNGNTTSAVSTMEPGTFSVTVTDNYGCTGTATQLVSAAPAPDPEVAGSLSLCNGGSTTLSVSGSFSSFAWSTGATTASVSVSSSGNYTVTVTSQYGCTGTSAVNVAISTFLTPNIAVDPYDCDNQLTLFAGAGYTSYQWSNGATTNNISVSEAGDYVLTVTNDAGCIGTAVQSVSAIPNTPALAIQGDNSFCANATTLLTATPGFDIYSWNNGDFTNAITVSATGDYTVTATDIYGCSKVAVFHTDALAIPIPSITTAPYACTGTLTLEGGGPYPSYLWQNGASGASLEIFTAGTYTVTVTSENGCTGTASTEIAAIPERLQILLNGPNRICPGATAVISANEGFAGYVWSTGSAALQISVTEAGIYTVTATDAYNCTSTSQLQIGLLDSPQPQIVAEPYNCNGIITLNAGNFATYEWSTGDQSATTEVEASGTYTVTVTNDDGCTGTVSAEALVPALPVAEITTSPGVNYSVVVEANAGFTAYAWSNGVQEATFTTHENGTYTVTVTDAIGCTGTAEVTVQLEAEPLITTAVSTEITCANSNDGQLEVCPSGGVGPYTFTVTPAMPFQLTSTAECASLFTTGNLPTGTYEWSVTDANGVSQSGTSTYTNPAPLFAGASVAGMTVTGTATGGQPPYQYSIDGVNYQSDPVFSDLPNGAYQVAVLDARGCTVLSPSVLVFVVGTIDVADNWQLQITPNPGSGDFRLRMNNCGADEVRITIVDVAGRLVRQQVVNTGGCNDFQYAIDLQNTAAGTYLVEVRTLFAVKTLPVVVVR